MCITLPYRLTRLLGAHRALAEGPDGEREITTTLLESPQPGTYVLVAYGTALREVPEEEAREILEVWRELQAAEASLPQ